MKLKYIISAICMVVFFGCQVKDVELTYPPEISYFEEDFVNHFPKVVPNVYHGLSVSQNLSNAHPHVWLNYITTEEEYDSVKTYIEQRAIAVYDSEDSCLLVMDRHLKNNNWRDYDKKSRRPRKVSGIDRECAKDKLPVPNFYNVSWRDTDSNDTGLIGYKLYVLEAKSGIFMDSTKLPNGVYTPEGWKHGYSKGVALNDENNELIYWSDIW